MTERFWAWPRAERRDLRRFGVGMAAALAALAGVAWYGGGEVGPLVPGVLGALLLLAGVAAPGMLRVPFGLWMYLARILAWVNTHLLLGLVFYSLFTAVGIVMRVVRYDPLRRRWEHQRVSYWQRRERPLAAREHFERQF